MTFKCLKTCGDVLEWKKRERMLNSLMGRVRRQRYSSIGEFDDTSSGLYLRRPPYSACIRKRGFQASEFVSLLQSELMEIGMATTTRDFMHDVYEARISRMNQETRKGHQTARMFRHADDESDSDDHSNSAAFLDPPKMSKLYSSRGGCGAKKFAPMARPTSVQRSMLDLLPADVRNYIFDLRRRAMARDLCARESQRRAIDRRIWPLGVHPTLSDRIGQKHEYVRIWCDKTECGHHEWMDTWADMARLWCQVCRRNCNHVTPHAGLFCSRECYMFV